MIPQRSYPYADLRNKTKIQRSKISFGLWMIKNIQTPSATVIPVLQDTHQQHQPNVNP